MKLSLRDKESAHARRKSATKWQLRCGNDVSIRLAQQACPAEVGLFEGHWAVDPAHAELSLPLEHPEVYAAVYDEDTSNFLMIMEDVTARGGEIELAAVSDRPRHGGVVVDHGWGSRVFDPRVGAAATSFGVNRNLLVGGHPVDPLSQTPALSSTYVSVERVRHK